MEYRLLFTVTLQSLRTQAPRLARPQVPPLGSLIWSRSPEPDEEAPHVPPGRSADAPPAGRRGCAWRTPAPLNCDERARRRTSCRSGRRRWWRWPGLHHAHRPHLAAGVAHHRGVEEAVGVGVQRARRAPPPGTAALRGSPPRVASGRREAVDVPAGPGVEHVDRAAAEVRRVEAAAHRHDVALAAPARPCTVNAPCAVVLGDGADGRRGRAEVVPGLARLSASVVPGGGQVQRNFGCRGVGDVEREVAAPPSRSPITAMVWNSSACFLSVGAAAAAAVHPDVAHHRRAVHQQLVPLADHVADELGQHVRRDEGPHLVAGAEVVGCGALAAAPCRCRR